MMDEKKPYDQPMRQAEKLKRALQKHDLDVITPEAILKAFEEEGYRSLEDYARKLSEVIQGQKGIPRRITFNAMPRQTSETIRASIKHKVPEVSFFVDGIENDPKDISRFDGQELLYVDGRNGLLVFPDPNVGNTLLQTLGMSQLLAETMVSDEIVLGSKTEPTTHTWPPDPWRQGQGPYPGGSWYPPPPPPPPPDPKTLFMYEDLDFQGGVLELKLGREIPKLSDFQLGWPWDDWNDQISSIKAKLGVPVFWEHAHFGGSYMTTNENHYLAEIGWNDRISSVRYYNQVVISG